MKIVRDKFVHNSPHCNVQHYLSYETFNDNSTQDNMTNNNIENLRFGLGYTSAAKKSETTLCGSPVAGNRLSYIT